MDSERADEQGPVRLPGSGQRAESGPAYGWRADPGGRYDRSWSGWPGGSAREAGIRRSRRASTWTAAALVAGVAAATGYLAHAIPSPATNTTVSSGTTSSNGKPAVHVPGSPAVGGPVVTSGGSGAVAGAGGASGAGGGYDQ